MDALKNFAEQAVGGQQGGNNNNDGNNNSNNNNNNNNSGGGGGFMDKLNSMAGGGKDSEKNEDYLDKGVDAFQQYVLKEGDQSNENAVEQAKDEQISDFIRKQYKSTTGSDFPVTDKETKF